MVIETYLKNERGLALVVALMLLVLLTVMGLAAITTTTTEIQLAGNERTDAQALHSAEAEIKEALFRTSLPTGVQGANTIANSGSTATVNGNTFDASISDAALNGGNNPNPKWEYNIYFGTPPASTDPLNVKNVRSLLSTDDMARLGYTVNSPPIKIEYLTEQDLYGWGFAFPVADQNGDGDLDDLVFYDPKLPLGPRRLSAAATVAEPDNAPPDSSINRNQVIRLITAQSSSGTATKKVILETTGFPIDPKANAAVQTGLPVAFGGNGFVSGYNHDEGTKPSDETNRNAALYNADGCDNYSGGANLGSSSGTCGLSGTDPDASAPALDYSGKATLTGSKPGVLSGSDPTTQGNSVEVWGGTDDQSAGWKQIDSSLQNNFPSLATLLGLNPADFPAGTDFNDTATVAKLFNPSTSTSACPSGVTFIDNKNSSNYTPAQNCASNQVASGILIVTGDMKVTSQMEFHGLIYVEGDTELRGGTWILGALAVKGKNTGVSIANGNPTVLYSNGAVTSAVTSAMNMAGMFSTLSWREK